MSTKPRILSILTILLIVISVAMATTTSVDLTNDVAISPPADHFSTNTNIATSLAVSSGGSPVSSGGSVCGGQSISVTPSLVQSNWASSRFELQMQFPECSTLHPHCPTMLNMSGSSSSHPITWLPASDYDSILAYGNRVGSGSIDNGGPDVYSRLGSFYNEPVTYMLTPRPGFDNVFPNKEAGVSIVCKGNMTVSDNGHVIATYDLSGPLSSSSIAMSGTSHMITSHLTGVDCFGVAIVHPIDTSPSPYYFVMEFFGNNRPTFPTDTMASSTVIVNTNPAGVCSLRSDSVTSTPSTASSNLVHVHVTNLGDAVTVNSVGGTVSLSAVPASRTLCDTLGFSSTVCPTNNGFGTPIPPGGQDDLYVIIGPRVGIYPFIPPSVTFTSEVTGSVASCSGTTSTCQLHVAIPVAPPGNSTNPTSCTITSLPPTAPPVLVGTGNIAHFGVTCTNYLNETVPCVGSAWSWTGGMSGRFQTDPPGMTNTEAFAIPLNPPGSSGSISYSSGAASCSLAVQTEPSGYVCDFTPPSATMNVAETRRFLLNCYKTDHTLVGLDSAGYGVSPTTLATTSNSDIHGTNATALPSGAGSSGLLIGDPHFVGTHPWEVGREATASISVNGAPSITSCSIDPASATVGQGDFRSFKVACAGPSGIVPCVGTNWSWIPSSFGFIIESSRTIASVYAGATEGTPIGSIGTMVYSTGSISCTSTVTSGPSIFACKLEPSSATMAVSDIRRFNLSCNRVGDPTPIMPTSVDYSTPGLSVVALTDMSNTGTTLKAEGPGSGDLEADAFLPGAYPTEGHYTKAAITINGDCPVPRISCNGSLPSCVICPDNRTSPTCPEFGTEPICAANSTSNSTSNSTTDKPGDTDYCSIGGGRYPEGLPAINFTSGQSHTVAIYCGPTGTAQCISSVSWNFLISSGTGATETSDVRDIDWITLNFLDNSTGSGTIYATIGSDPTHACSRDVNWNVTHICQTES